MSRIILFIPLKKILIYEYAVAWSNPICFQNSLFQPSHVYFCTLSELISYIILTVSSVFVLLCLFILMIIHLSASQVVLISFLKCPLRIYARITSPSVPFFLEILVRFFFLEFLFLLWSLGITKLPPFQSNYNFRFL